MAATIKHLVLALAAVLASAAAQAAVYRCVDEQGKVYYSEKPCPPLPDHSPRPPPAPPLRCSLAPEQRQQAVRAETQFLRRFHDERSHRQAQWADVSQIAGKVTGAYGRYLELRTERKAIDEDIKFHPDGKLPAKLRDRLDANEAKFAALSQVFGDLEHDLAQADARYDCQRKTFAQLWAGAAPGSSACDPPPPGCAAS